PALTMTLTPTNGTCGGTGGSILATFGGGTPPYQIQIDGGGFAAATSPTNFPSLGTGSHTVDLKDANNCPLSQAATLTQPTCGQITPTATTCADFIGGTSGDLTQACYGVKSGKVNNTAPGVFFYYTRVTAPSASFTVTIVETKNNASFPFFVTQGGPAGEVR